MHTLGSHRVYIHGIHQTKSFVSKGVTCNLQRAICNVQACNTDTTQTQLHQISNTQRNENKTTNVVIQRHSRKLLMIDILMFETC